MKIYTFNQKSLSSCFDIIMRTLLDLTAMRTLLDLTAEQKEDKFQNLIAQAPVLVATFIGPEFIVATINKMALDIWCKSYEDVINKPLFASSPELKAGLKNILDYIYQTGEPFISNEIPVELKRLGKFDKVYFNSVYQPLLDGDKKIYGIILIGTEITEAVNALKEVEISELFNRSVLESSPDCVKVLDLQGRIEYMNHNGLCQMEIDDFSTFKNTDWTTIFGIDNELLARASINKALKGESSKFTALCPTAKGNPKWWDVVVTPLCKTEGYVHQILSVSRDVTEAKKAEQKNIEARELFELTLHNVPSAVYHINNKGEILYLNQLAAEQMGYDSMEEVLNEKDVYQFRQKIDEKFDILNEKGQSLGADESCSSITLKTGKPAEVVIKFINKKTGISFWLLTKSVPLLDNNGELTNVFTTCTDITQQKEAQIQLDKIASHFKLSTDSANVGVWSLDVKTQQLEWSGLHKKMWGYDEHRTDLTYEDWHKIIMAEDKELAFSKVEEARINNSFYEVEYRINKADDKKIRYIRSVGKYHYNNLGEAEILAGISIDITEQKNTEDVLKKTASNFKLATDSANVGVWSLDVQTQELEWSSLHKNMWGYDEHRSDLTFEDWHSIILSEDKALAFKKVEEAKVTRSLYEVEYRIKRPNDNAIRWMRAVGQYYYNDADEAVTLTGISLDITEQKTFTEELEKKVLERTKELDLRSKQLEELNSTLDAYNVALENANAELKSFSYIVSHDLQEPLRMIRMFSKKIMDSETFTEKTQGYFDFIISAADRMKNLIVSLINYSNTSKDEQAFVLCNLNEIVEESKKDLQLIIFEKNAVIEIDSLPTIKGMHFQLCQLFTNLIGNALKYSRANTNPHIKINFKLSSGIQIDHPLANKHKEYYAIIIADNGIGFESEYKSKIFDVFQRLHARNEYSGTGIGLSIVKKIVTNHNGFIVADGQLNVGATFTIYIPVD